MERGNTNSKRCNQILLLLILMEGQEKSPLLRRAGRALMTEALKIIDH
jgi:hypothetical protein